jgi:hypothetical protein
MAVRSRRRDARPDGPATMPGGSAATHCASWRTAAGSRKRVERPRAEEPARRVERDQVVAATVPRVLDGVDADRAHVAVRLIAARHDEVDRAPHPGGADVGPRSASTDPLVPVREADHVRRRAVVRRLEPMPQQAGPVERPAREAAVVERQLDPRRAAPPARDRPHRGFEQGVVHQEVVGDPALAPAAGPLPRILGSRGSPD